MSESNRYKYLLFICLFIGMPFYAMAGIQFSESDLLRFTSHCKEPLEFEPHITRKDFPFRDHQGIDDMGETFENYYNSSKRLYRRAYWSVDLKQIIVPVTTSSETVENVTVPPLFIESIQTQLKLALQRRYAHYAFFPDMGHSHFMISEIAWDEKYAALSREDKQKFYEKLLQDEGLKIFYHTAEQLAMTDEKRALLGDPLTQWRYYSRNILGSNTGKDTYLEVLFTKDPKSFNTVRSYPDFRWWGPGFYLHANKNGCFSYEQADGRRRYFDISFHPFPSGVPPLTREELLRQR